MRKEGGRNFVEKKGFIFQKEKISVIWSKFKFRIIESFLQERLKT
jgi:hypothetical protein